VGTLHPFRKRDTASRREDLLQALLDAVERQDASALMSLINENSDAIRKQFRSWITVPETIREDPAAVDRYGRTLFVVASLFEQSGDSSLKNYWTDKRRGLVEWQKEMERASGLIDSSQAAEAIPILHAVLEQMTGMTGPGADSMRARGLGRLGIALWKTGDIPEAIRVTREALALCQRAGDTEGINAYQNNLREIGTYEIAKGDDPGVGVVFTDAEGRILTREDLPQARGTIRWEVRFAGKSTPKPNGFMKKDARLARAASTIGRSRCSLELPTSIPRGHIPSTTERFLTC